jgi:hypothetical protein
MMIGAGASDEDAQRMMDASHCLSNLMMDENVTEDELAVYRRKLIDAKMTSEQADTMVRKVRESIELKRKLAAARDSLAGARDRAATKFAPGADDDAGMLWGKALRFMSLKMPDEARACIDMLRSRNTPEFPPVALDTAETVLFAGGDLPFEAGLLVTLFEAPATSHAIYKIGDVITEVDGKPCRRFEDYRAKAGRVYTVYRRRPDGSFQKLVSEMPEGQPRVALVNMKENK